MTNAIKNFTLDDKVCIITGGGGLLGSMNAEAIAEAGGTPVLWDINTDGANLIADRIQKDTGKQVLVMRVDITNKNSVRDGLSATLRACDRVDVLINNAANDPKVDAGSDLTWSRFENISMETWSFDLEVGLTGAFLCAQVAGTWMAENGGGVILNIASDLSVIAPDQRLYRQDGLSEDQQPVKPVTYSVLKHGLIGLTKYLATYWASKNIRCNAISPGGIYNGQPAEFVSRLTDLIPAGRMANKDEYKSAVVFLCSDASSYMTGHNLVMDGGRSVL